MQGCNAWACLIVFLVHARSAAASQQQLLMSKPISFAEEWEILGPFKYGTREAIWQPDPLEVLGGFPHLDYDEQQLYPSPLTTNATVGWERRAFNARGSPSQVSVDLLVSHEDVDWKFLQSIYGWQALQFQTWVRGVLHNHQAEPIKIALHAPGVLQFTFEGYHERSSHFGVDFYGFERAPIVLELKPGTNIFNVRLVRDVRANGGQIPPSIEATLRAEVLTGNASIVERSLIVPDILHGRFISPLASLTITNTADVPILVESILVNAPKRGEQTTHTKVWIAVGQSRPLLFRLDEIYNPSSELVATVHFRQLDHMQLEEIYVPFLASGRGIEEPQRLTFLHPSGSLSYAVLLPPSRKTVRQHKGPLPVLVGLHGSGLDVNSYQLKHSFDGAPNFPAWILFPTGMSTWCGDDWHNWGLRDVDAALEAIPDWIKHNHWDGPGVYIDRFLLAGHSNGGHGTWHITLHQPDRVIAAAPASGYTSIDNYVPFTMWDDADPAQLAVLAAARAPFRQELFLENLKAKPVLVQHGELDDNVPAYHSRLMKAYSVLKSAVEIDYAEIPAKLHWWDGAMTTEPMLKFYDQQIRDLAIPPIIPDEFHYNVADTSEFGSLHGIHVDQVIKPDVLARVSVDTRSSKNLKKWKIRTRNVRRLRLDRSKMGDAQTIQIDERSPDWSVSELSIEGSFVLEAGRWIYENIRQPADVRSRTGKQRGSMDSILRTAAPFRIVTPKETYEIALQISNTLLQYFGADSEIRYVEHHEKARQQGGNVIVIALAGSTPQSLLQSFPIFVDEGCVFVREKDEVGRGRRIRNASSATWLQPLEGERLELVLWGVDVPALQQAARLIPTLTGAGKPDFTIFEHDKLNGVHSRVAAMGFFDFAWNISAASYVP
ncbi:uncharacterized protein HMPREF1541_08608 [Cyphellophora europaea CBS 101466]|uniref:Peptidase S9 prolyl oligopeptidase catalytic domain-containing protein n=1 Tax=Cyphellophora europaea (strain CBS 101466) TaxID=1220924 RepID=W2RIN6_CYPE1|nr:uncharacterized protein HMPREF1541_08608 [Cyphellophora europaea CBS 101466]ETN36331.1 hypothetical protein HMPREF1541_08608 [Cyphellophora europaea CBS 101466]